MLNASSVFSAFSLPRLRLCRPAAHSALVLACAGVLLGCSPSGSDAPEAAASAAVPVDVTSAGRVGGASAVGAAQTAAHEVYDDAPTPSLASQAASTGIPAEVAQLLDAAHIRSDNVSLLVAPVEGGTPLVNYRSSAMLNPASVMKMVTTAAALDVLGPTYTWRTPIWLDGQVRDGTLRGNAYMQGRGDPKLVLERLWLLLRELRQSGLHTIDGDLVLDNTAFEVPQQNPGAFDGAPLRAYNATADALLVNYKTITLSFAPEPLAQLAHVHLDPPLTGVRIASTIPLNNQSCAQWENQIKARFGDALSIGLNGSYPASCGRQRMTLAYAAPEQYAARAIAGMWQQLGGGITGSVRYGSVPQALTRQPPAAQSQSPALPEIIRDINKHSNNVMAQQVFLTMGLEQSGVGSQETATRAIADWWRSRLGQTPQPVVENGSGLSRTGRISTSSLAAMLQAVWYTPTMAEYISSLPIVGVDGTLRRSRLRSKGAAHLKTGTLANASALAGYVQAHNGHTYVLAAIANGAGAPAARRAFEALVDWTANLPAPEENTTYGQSDEHHADMGSADLTPERATHADQDSRDEPSIYEIFTGKP